MQHQQIAVRLQDGSDHGTTGLRGGHLLWPSTTMGMYTEANVSSDSSADRLSNASDITCKTSTKSRQSTRFYR